MVFYDLQKLFIFSTWVSQLGTVPNQGRSISSKLPHAIYGNLTLNYLNFQILMYLALCEIMGSLDEPRPSKARLRL